MAESTLPLADRTRLLLDNSVWQRMPRPKVRAAVEALLAQVSPLDVLICPPVAAEVGFSARDGKGHDRVRQALAEFPDCEKHPGTSLVLDIQNRLWKGGLLRAVGATDTEIAAYAIANGATVVHYDADFEHVAKVWPDFRHRWVMPRGSVD
ncbi:MAG: PIN domain-containing protein [Actinobacteria bacterium]|nr:PIN domain-containing protein [Actinomycetota bacterium]